MESLLSEGHAGSEYVRHGHEESSHLPPSGPHQTRHQEGPGIHPLVLQLIVSLNQIWETF